MIDLSFVIGGVIAVMLAVICTKLWPIIRAAVPPAVIAAISWFADTIVKAVEAEYGRGRGEEKKQEAFKRINRIIYPLVGLCERMGFTIDAERIYDAIQAAWIQLNLEQIAVGEKAGRLESECLSSDNDVCEAAAAQGNVDVEITHWSLSQLAAFCAQNGIDASGCKTREEYIDAIERAYLPAQEGEAWPQGDDGDLPESGGLDCK